MSFHLEIPVNVSFFQFVAIEGVVTAVVDLFPRFLRRGYRKELFTAIVCIVWFLIGLSMVTEVIIFTYSDSLLRQILTYAVLEKCEKTGDQQNMKFLSAKDHPISLRVIIERFHSRGQLYANLVGKHIGNVYNIKIYPLN